MQDFRSLKVWQRSHSLTLEIYRETRAFPADERFELSRQLRRAAVSIGSNLAEGCGRGSDADFARFCQQAMGSACEVECQLLIARDLGYLKPERHESLERLVVEVKRMLSSLMTRLRS